MHDVKILDVLPIEPGATYVMDRGYIDYRRLYAIHQARAHFIVRAKQNLRFVRMYSHLVDRSTGIRCDQTICFAIPAARGKYPEPLRRVKYRDQETNTAYVFLTNNWTLTAPQVADLYRHRWDIEQFFRWIKGHLKIQRFWGTSPNAVKTQIWVAVCTYLMVVIVRRQLHIERSMYEILQILSITIFEKTPMNTLFFEFDLSAVVPPEQKQQSLLEF